MPSWAARKTNEELKFIRDSVAKLLGKIWLEFLTPWAGYHDKNSIKSSGLHSHSTQSVEKERTSNTVCSPHVSSQLRLLVGEFLLGLIQLDVFVSRITFGGAKLLYLQSLTRHFTRSFPVLKHGHVPFWWLTLRNENLASILDVRNMPHFADPAWKEEFGATWVPSSETIYVYNPLRCDLEDCLCNEFTCFSNFDMENWWSIMSYHVIWPVIVDVAVPLQPTFTDPY